MPWCSVEGVSTQFVKVSNLCFIYGLRFNLERIYIPVYLLYPVYNVLQYGFVKYYVQTKSKAKSQSWPKVLIVKGVNLLDTAIETNVRDSSIE